MNVREWALPVYTILMQLAVGALFLLWVIRSLARSRFTTGEIDRMIRNPILVITLTSVLAMIGAHFHLSKPFHSFLALINLDSSWLSREILFTVLFFLSTTSLWYLSRNKIHHQRFTTYLGWLSILFGFIVVYCMSRIYVLPTQVAWNSPTVIVSFLITTLLVGGMTIACLMVLDLRFAEIQKSEDIDLRIQVIKYSLPGLSLVSFMLVLLTIVVTYVQILLLQRGDIAARTSLRLLFELYMPLFVMRATILLYASISLGYAIYRMYRLQVKPQSIMIPVYLSCLLIFVGEIIGRFLFYATHIRIGL